MKFNYVELIKFLLIAIVIHKSYDFVSEKSTFDLAVDANKLSSYLILGIFLFHFYKEIIYSIIIIRMQNLYTNFILKRANHTNNNHFKLPHNYRTFLRDKFGISIEKTMSLYLLIRGEFLEKDLHFDKDKQHSSAIHFFYMSSFVFFYFVFHCMYIGNADSAAIFFLAFILFFVVGFHQDIMYEKRELDLIKSLIYKDDEGFQNYIDNYKKQNEFVDGNNEFEQKVKEDTT